MSARDAMTPEDALRTMATVTSNTRGLRVRTEGLTLVVWAICMAASYLTIVAPILHGGPGPDYDGGLGQGWGGRGRDDAGDGGARGNATDPRVERPGPRGPPSTEFFLGRHAPLAWYAVALVTTIAIWRSASLSFQTGMTTPRLLVVLVAWLALFAVVSIVLAFVQGGNPRSWHLAAWAVVIGLLALLNPLRFTTPGRVATAVMATTVALAAVYAVVMDLGGRDVGFLSGLALGLSGLGSGLWLMFRG